VTVRDLSIVWVKVPCPECGYYANRAERRRNERARKRCTMCKGTGETWKTTTRDQADAEGLDFAEGEEPPK
jgi:predicted RNA-binding Zn-ribbon protein involved in translation (DUF1610 family)